MPRSNVSKRKKNASPRRKKSQPRRRQRDPIKYVDTCAGVIVFRSAALREMARHHCLSRGYDRRLVRRGNVVIDDVGYASLTCAFQAMVLDVCAVMGCPVLPCSVQAERVQENVERPVERVAEKVVHSVVETPVERVVEKVVHVRDDKLAKTVSEQKAQIKDMDGVIRLLSVTPRRDKFF